MHIAADNSTAADALLADIEALTVLLLDNPHLGRARPELADTLRNFPVGNYVLFYRLQAYGIELVRVLHGARDLPHEFQLSNR